MRARCVAVLGLSLAIIASRPVVGDGAGGTTLVVSGITTPRAAGSTGSVTVEARTAGGARATTYAGTIRFTSTDAQAVLPANYKFTSADAGIHTFVNAVVLKTAGTQTVTATDTVTATIKGTQAGIVVNALAVSRFGVSGISTPRPAGTASSVTVQASDAFGNRVTTYTGTVRFTSSDEAATLPANYTFTSADSGTHAFANGVTLKTVGTQSVTATDAGNSAVTGAQTGIVVNPGAASKLAVSGIASPRTANTASNVTLTAKDAFGNTATAYTGTVHFTSTDAQALLPANYKFVSGDAGTHTFTNGVTLKTVGTQSVTASEATAAFIITGSQTGIQVVSNAATALVISGFASPSNAGTSSSFTVEARDALGNRSTGYAGTVRFTSSDPQATVPGNFSFAGAGGIAFFGGGATLRTAGTQSVSAADISAPAIAGARNGIVVNAASATALALSGVPATVTAGGSSSATVAALDPYGNVATSYLGTVHFTSSDLLASLPPDHTFVPGDLGIATVSGVTFRTAGTQRLSAADTLTPSMVGTQSGISVVGAATTSLSVAGLVTPRAAGAAGSITVTALDAYGNTATAYRGTVAFTSTDAQAALPAPTTFASSDAGVRAFAVTLKTVGTQSVTATDTVTSSITGTQVGISVGPGAASTLLVSGVTSPVATGVATSVTVDARDAYGNRATGYLGTVAFTASDTQAVLPAQYAFQPADAGLHVFTNAVVFRSFGTQSLTATDTTTAAITGTQSGISVIDSTPPTWPAGSTLTATATSTTSAHLAWSAATDNAGVTAYRVYQNGSLAQTLSGATLATDVSGLTPGVAVTFQVQAGDAAGNWTTDGPIALLTSVPPDPALVAPPLDMTVATTAYDATSFLYSGPNPIQTGVPAGSIQPTQVAALRGTVHDRVGQPVPGVRISVLNHAEYGQTLTRADGAYDLVVNGGQPLNVKYDRSDLLSVQRTVTAAWQEYTAVPDVVMVPYDQLSTVFAAGSTDTQVARGSTSIDELGSRQATVVFPPGTGASLKMPDGSTQSVGTLHLRATELTVGPTGPRAMPGPLPPSSAYTYAVALTSDEAVQAGASSIQFSQPVFGYVENFLTLPVGSTVPAGSYDTTGGRWVPESNGKVIKILSVTNGLADLDTNGDGAADNAATLASLGVSAAEQAQLASLYQPGQSLWRMPLQHFSWVDWNLGLAPPLDIPPPPPPDADPPDPDDDPDCASGCVVEVQNQALGEHLSITGTPYELHYRSSRVPGRRANYRLNLNLPPIPTIFVNNVTVCLPNRVPECQRVTVSTPLEGITSSIQVTVAGRTFRRTSDEGGPWHFEWDGKDRFGRETQGEQIADLKSCIHYPGIGYGSETDVLNAFAQPSLAGAMVVWRWVGSFSEVFDVCAPGRTKLGGWNVKPVGLGGWTLSSHQMLDVPNRTVYRGDGGIQRVDDMNRYLLNFTAGTGFIGTSQSGLGTPISDGVPASTVDLNGPRGLVVGPDGSVYFTDQPRGIIGRVTRDGMFHIFAGKPNGFGSNAEGALASQANLNSPAGLALGLDATVYFVDGDTHRIRKVTPDGRVFTVAGNGTTGFAADGTPALSAALNLDREARGIAVGPDGTLYFPDTFNHRIRKVGSDGILRTAAGSGPVDGSIFSGALSGDGGPALQARLNRPQGVTLAADGSLFIADSCNRRVRKVTPDGLIATVAGSGPSCFGEFGFSGDGGPATSASLSFPLFSVAVAPDGTFFIADFATNRVRRVSPSGTIDTIAGSATAPCAGKDCPAPSAALGRLNVVAFGPAGDVYAGVGDGMQRIVRLSSASAKEQVTTTDVVVPSRDATEIYVFDLRGRHLRTLDALTNAQLRLFGYDPAGRLASITDRDGNVTTIQRDAQGNVTSISSPFGQTTGLTVDSNGYLSSVTNPNNETVQLSYKPVVAGDPHTGGLLSQYTDARNGSSVYEYDPDGFLTRDTRPDGSFQTFSRGGTLAPNLVTRTTALGRTDKYGRSFSETRDKETRTSRDPAGLVTTAARNQDESSVVTYPDGTSITSTVAPDPRFGIQAGIASTMTRTPSGLTRIETRSRTVSLSNPNDPLSLASLIEQVTVNGRTSSSTYGAAAKTITRVTPMGRQTVSALDALGRVRQIQPPGTLQITIGHDPQGRPQAITQGSRVTTMSYRPDGFLGSVLDPLLQTTSFGYDLAGRVTSTTLPNSTTIGTSYDANGNVTSVTPPGRPAYGFTYTAGDQEKDYTPPDVGQPGTTHTDYNLDQQVSSVLRPDGEFIAPTYDPANGRLTAQTTSRGANEYVYSPSTGQLTSVTTFDGVALSYGYDGPLLNDVTWTGQVSGNVHKTYDSSFRVSSQSVTGGQTIDFAYDNDDLLTNAGALTITRDPATGFVASTDLGLVHETYAYDAYGAMQTHVVTANGATLYSVDYGTRDALGRIVTKTETIQGEPHAYRYTYDANGRLTDVAKDSVATSHYEYDANGNRIIGPGLTTSPLYDTQDRLLSYGECTYTYKADGSLHTKTCPDGTTTYDYDAFGNLRGVTLPNGTPIAYVIDGQNRRVGKKVNDVLVESFLYEDDLKRVGWYDGTGVLRAQFVFGSRLHVPDYMTKAGQNYRFIYDQVGSVRQIVASDGTVAESLGYDEFGNVLTDSAPGFQPFGFAGGLTDGDSRLIRFGTRDYAPSIGRWLSTDSLRFLSGDSNLYVYVNSDPVNEYDQYGLARTPKTCVEAFTLARNTLNEIIKTIRDAVRFLRLPTKSGPSYENRTAAVSTKGSDQENIPELRWGILRKPIEQPGRIGMVGTI